MKMRPRLLPAIAVVILLAQALVSAKLGHDPYLPTPPPLDTFPFATGNWRQVQEIAIEPEVISMLGPDDILSRQYVNVSGKSSLSFFMSYYRTQLRAKNAHDPKVCLPGSGWNPRSSKVISLDIPDRTQPLPVNYYRIAKGESEAVVLYWFQTHKGAYAGEQELRFHRLIDAAVDNRTDMALVRIVVPVEEQGVDHADSQAIEFVRAIYRYVLHYFPPKQ